MKETTWQDCLTNNTAKSITPDLRRAQSLQETAKERIHLIEEVNETVCPDYYSHF